MLGLKYRNYSGTVEISIFAWKLALFQKKYMIGVQQDSKIGYCFLADLESFL